MKPIAEAMRMDTRGRPFRSMYARIFGAWPWPARAAKVREEPKMDELPTDNTAMRITTFMIDGKTVMPAFLMEMTNGEAAASALLPDKRRVSSYGTRTPMRRRETM